jgi:hypothetical protein
MFRMVLAVHATPLGGPLAFHYANLMSHTAFRHWPVLVYFINSTWLSS